jgi:sugar-specific transcriptional regulator TrmB
MQVWETKKRGYAWAMLELGPVPALDIAARAGVNRPTAYFYLEQLKQKGLVSTQINKGKQKLFHSRVA